MAHRERPPPSDAESRRRPDVNHTEEESSHGADSTPPAQRRGRPRRRRRAAPRRPAAAVPLTASGPALAQTTQKKELITAQSGDVSKFDPHFSTSSNDIRGSFNLFANLPSRHPDGTLYPGPPPRG